MVSKPEIPGMRTSEIIIPTSWSRRTWRACSPEETVVVSNPCPVRNEVSKLRWLASSSTISTRGSLREVFPPSGGMASNPGHELEMSDAEDRTVRFVTQTFDLPAMSEHILTHHGQAQASALFVSGDVGFEDFGSLTEWD